jgi:hypothetical protein
MVAIHARNLNPLVYSYFLRGRRISQAPFRPWAWYGVSPARPLAIHSPGHRAAERCDGRYAPPLAANPADRVNRQPDAQPSLDFPQRRTSGPRGADVGDDLLVSMQDTGTPVSE